MEITRCYSKKISEILDAISKTEEKNILRAAHLIYKTVKQSKHVYVFGCTHSSILAEELYYRAGSLAIYEPIFAPGLSVATTRPLLTTYMERNEQYGIDIVKTSKLTEGDTLILISTSGKNAVPVSVAIESKNIGANVIAITSKAYEKYPSNHSSNKKLLNLDLDVIINNHVPAGDSVMELNGITMGPVSTIAGAFILHSISMEVAKIYIENGEQPKVLVSSNTPEGEKMNRKLLENKKIRDLFTLP